ncbi:MAG: hypothetical protein V4436_00030 [Patescibacteria group bacterium]
MFVAVPAYAATLFPDTPSEKCVDEIYADEELSKEAFSGSKEVLDRRQDMLTLCRMHDPYNEDWQGLQWVMDTAAERTGGPDAYLASLGVSAEQLESAIEQIRVFRARQAYARFYQLMRWERHPTSSSPTELSDLYLAYGALLDPSTAASRPMYRDAYHAQFEQVAPDSFMEFDKILGFDTDVKIGKNLQCVGWEGFIGFSIFDLIMTCGLNEWPPPVYPLVSQE